MMFRRGDVLRSRPGDRGRDVRQQERIHNTPAADQVVAAESTPVPAMQDEQVRHEPAPPVRLPAAERP